MVWVRFTQNYNFVPDAKPTVSVAYKAGDEYNVTRECADKVIAIGRGELMDKQSRDADPKPAEEVVENDQFADEDLDAWQGDDDQVEDEGEDFEEVDPAEAVLAEIEGEMFSG